MKRTEIMNMPSVAYYSGLNGLEIKSIEYGIDDYIICVSGAWGGPKTVHRVKVNYTAGGRDYIRVNGCRVYLDECIRM